MNKKYYFLVGIGGISMSGIAKLLKLSGQKVVGSDLTENEEIKTLGKIGIKVIIGQKAENISSKIDVLIYTSAAAHPNSPGLVEIKKAEELKIPIYKRSEFIGNLMAKKFGITVAGMHGKTTTTAMLGFVLKKMSQAPVVLLGGEFKQFSDQNLEFSKKGVGKYFVCEGCEYDRSFLDFKNKAAIITNIEEEHLDYFEGGLPEILDVFKKFLSQIPKSGFAVLGWDNKNVRSVAKSAKCKIIKYSKKELSRLPSGKIKLTMPGEHNQLNALAALKVIQELGLDVKEAKKILAEFPGVGRRFEILGKKRKTIFIDDYAHHPTEIQTILTAVRKFYGNKKLLVIFQPHQYSRTKLLLKDFAKSFGKTDYLAITDVYEVAGREEDKSVGSKELAAEIAKTGQKVEHLPSYEDVFKFLKKNYPKFDVIMTMGAGPINEVAKKFLKGQ